jgi:hypothetical protein
MELGSNDEIPPPPPPPPPPQVMVVGKATFGGHERGDDEEQLVGGLLAGVEGVQVSGVASKKRVAAAPGEQEAAAAAAGGPARRTATRASSRESSQRAAARKRSRTSEGSGPAPNASLFVGYVEDGETIEMIMKKFERLEEIKREAAAAAAASAAAASASTTSSSSSSSSGHASPGSGQDGLDDATLAKVFQETSAFTVQSATREAREPGYFYDEDDLDELMDEAEDDGWDWGDMRATQGKDGETLFLVGDGTDDDLWEEVFGVKKKKKGGRSTAGGKGGSRGPGSRHETGVTQVAFVSDMHGRFVTGLKKVRKVDPNAIVYQKIPSEVTRSWAKAIQPYRPRSALEGTHTEWRPDAITCAEEQFPVSCTRPLSCEQLTVASVLDRASWAAASPVAARAPFEAIVLSPPWREARLGHTGGEEGDQGNPNNDPQGIEPEDLIKLGLGSSALLAAGFVFVWTPKHLILRVLRVLEQMDLHYVENAVVVKQRCNNELWREPSRYLRQSKETLLICRRGKKHPSNGKIAWARVEIRHQRTSDVHFEFCRPDREARGAGAHLVPHAYVHNMVETMLPLGRFNPLERSKKPAKADQLETLAHAEGEGEDEGEAHTEVDGRTTPQEQVQVQVQHPGKLLHLWAPRGALRTGWVSVCQSG